MNKRKIKINKKVIARNILLLAFIITLIIQYVDICKHFEKYSTTARYQLKNKIINNDATAIDYYNKNYLSNNIKLFDNI